MLPIRSVPGRLDSLRVLVIQAIGEATTVIASRTCCSVAIAGVRYPSTGRQGQTTGVNGTGKRPEKGQDQSRNRFLTPLIPPAD